MHFRCNDFPAPRQPNAEAQPRLDCRLEHPVRHAAASRRELPHEDPDPEQTDGQALRRPHSPVPVQFLRCDNGNEPELGDFLVGRDDRGSVNLRVNDAVTHERFMENKICVA